MRSMVLEMALQPGADELELAERYRAIVEQLTPMISPLLEGLMSLHLRDVVRTEAVTAAERESGQLPGAREVTVCFADLVGFTKLGEEVPPDELGHVADRLSVLTSEVVEPPVRFVKTIGDASMLVSPDPKELVDAALALVEAADAEGADFPQLRAGVALGPALSRAGDWYGRPVNLASRVTTIARPGSVLATKELRETLGEHYRWSSAGARSFKGITGSTRLFRARPREGAQGD
jgi:adenylate cyclase